MTTRDSLESLASELIREVASLRSAREFRNFLRVHRDLDGEALWNDIRNRQVSAELQPPGPFEAICALIRDGQAGDAGQAWSRYSRSRAEFNTTQPAAMTAVEHVREQLEARAFDDVLQGVDEVKERLFSQGHMGPFMMVLSFEGQAAFQTQTGNRAQNLERAGACFQQAVGIAHSFNDRAAIDDLTNKLAAVLAERIRGDALDDLTSAETLMREAIGTMPATDTDAIAMRQTNLASILLRRYDRERDDAIVEDAIALCRNAATLRPVEHDPEGWAYTQLVLGDALHTLAGPAKPHHLEEAVRILKRIITEGQEVPDKKLIAGAYLRLGVITSAAQTGQEMRPHLELGGADAFSMFRQALALAGDDRVLHGRIQLELGTAYERLKLHDLAANAMIRSLEFLQPTNSPDNCARATGFLGNYFAECGEWRECARYSLIAVQVAELKIHSQMNRATRLAEMKRAGNTYRWAAFALARAGEAVTAAVVLEQGRARELRSRLLPTSTERSLDDLPTELRARYENALTDLRASPFGDAGGSAVRAMMEATAAVRSLRGFEDFGMMMSGDDVAAGAAAGWPMIYINPTPWGTLLLSVSSDVTGSGPTFGTHVLEDVKSGAVAAMLLVGVTEPDEYDGSSDVYSYILSIGSDNVHDDIHFRTTLDRTLAWVGQEICSHLPKMDALCAADGVTLIVSGLLGMVPLHSASWVEAEAITSLIDLMPVRYAASALTCANAMQRVGQLNGVTPRLVALSNPTGDLPASEAEVDAIVDAFGPDASVVASREAATSSFLINEGPTASHLHLACHARASTFGEAAVVDLADGPLALGSSSETFSLNARLTVMSACQTGVWTLTDVGDEMLSMAAAVHALGSASVVATLWPVNSFATAILVCRFYDELLRGAPPAAALRTAQLWIRDLDGAGLIDFSDEHPLLSERLRRRGMPHVTADAAKLDDTQPMRPFQHPDYWAGFIALGV